MEKALPFKPFVVDEPNKDTMNAVNRVNKREGLKKISGKEFDNMLDK
jgi:antitoxin component of RelBE/YafQ-DinJ toxin-antitoxin module